MNKNKELKEKIKDMETEDLMKALVNKMGYEFSNETIISEKADNYNEEKEDLYTGYLLGFDEVFETHTQERLKETPLLMNLFQNFIQEIYKPSKLYNIAIEIKSRINEDLKNTLDVDQRKLLEQWQFCEDRILDDMIEQAFIYGYALSAQLRYEAIKKYPYKKE